MGKFLDEVRTAAAYVRSDSGAVAVTQSSFHRPKVEINVRKLDGHDESSLAEEIEQTIASARAVHAEELQEVAERHEHNDETPPGNVVTRHMPDIASELDELVGVGSSRRGHVKVSASGDGDFLVQFQGNAVRRTDIANTVLAPEVNEAIAQAMHAVADQVRRLLRQRVASPDR